MGIFSSRSSAPTDDSGGSAASAASPNSGWNSHQQALWVADRASNQCQVCSATFGFLFGRRHHCRQCGALCCGECTGHRAKARGYLTLQRVCSKCMAELVIAEVREAGSRRGSGAAVEPAGASSASSSTHSESRVVRRGGSNQPAPDRSTMRIEDSLSELNNHDNIAATEPTVLRTEESVTITTTGHHNVSASTDSTISTTSSASYSVASIANATHHPQQSSTSSLPPRPLSRPPSPTSASASSPRSSVRAGIGGGKTSPRAASPGGTTRRKSISGSVAFQPHVDGENVAASAPSPKNAPVESVVSSSSSSSSSTATETGLATVSPLCLFNRLGGFGSLLVLDVRSSQAYKEGHVPRSLSLPMSQGDLLPANEPLEDPAALLTALEQRLHLTDQRAFRMRQRCTVVLVGDASVATEGDSISTSSSSSRLQPDFSLTPPLHPAASLDPCATYLSRLLTLESKVSSVEILSGGFAEFTREFPFMSCLYTPREVQSGKHIHKKPFPGYPSIITQDFIVLGSKVDSQNKEHLLHLGVKAVLNCTNDLRNPFDEDKDENTGEAIFQYKRLMLQDEVTVSIKGTFAEAFEFLDSRRSSGGRVLVHCMEGISRSPTIVIAYLMKTYSLSLYDIYTYVKSQRKQVFPNLGFWKQLAAWEEELHASRNTGTPFVSTLDKCIDVALLTEEYKARKAINEEYNARHAAEKQESTTASPSPSTTSTITGPGMANNKTLWGLRGVASEDAQTRAEEAIVEEAMTPVGPIVTAE